MKTAIYSGLAVVLLLVIFPVYAVLLMAFAKAPGFASVITPFDTVLTLEHFKTIIWAKSSTGDWLFFRQLFNSLFVSFLATSLGLFLSSSAAYAFSRFQFLGKTLGLSAFVLTQMFPATMLMVPLYILIDALGLTDHVMGLIVAYSTTSLPFCIWMLKGYFDTIPTDLDEAALVDGAPRFTIFYRVILPLAKPALVVTGLFSFMTAWNEFILAATLLSREEAFTLPVTLYRHVGAFGADWGAFAAGSIIVSIPVVVLFFVLQRYLVGGLTSGGVK